MVVESFSVAAVVVVGADQRRHLRLLDRDAYDWYVAELPDGLCLELTVTTEGTPAGPRVQQKRYWWAVIVPRCAKHFNRTDKQMSRDLLSECFGFEWSAFEQLVPIKASLSMLSAEEMSHLLEWVREWAPEGLEIPVPDKDWRTR